MLKKICSILSTILLVFLAVIAAALIVPKLLGYQQFAVLSGSMEPTIHVGAIVYDKEAEPSELTSGDVITYRLAEGTLVTHRMVSVDDASGTVITKGDANETEDAVPVAFSQIVGRYAFNIPLLGYLAIYGKTPLGVAAVCGILVLMILLNFLPDALSPEKKDGEEDKKQ